MPDNATDVSSDQISAALNAIKGGGADAAIPPAATPTAGGDLLKMPQFPSMPKLHDVPRAPQDQFENPMRQFGGPAMFLAALGSLMTRHPMKTALDSAAGMINADVKGQKDQKELHRQNWGMATEQALAQNRIELERYHAIMAKYEHDTNVQAATMMAMASAFGDQTMINMAKVSPEKIPGLLQDRQKQHDKIEELKIKQQELDLKKREQDRKDNLASGGVQDQETLNEMADQYLAGDKSVFQNLGRGQQGSANIQALRNTIQQKMREQGITGAQQAAKLAEYGALTAGMRASGTREAGIGMAVNEANNMIPLAIKASEADKRRGSSHWNAAQQKFEVEFGDENYAKFVAATNSLVNVYNRAVSGGTGTVSGAEEARKVINPTMPHKAYVAAVNQMKQEMEAALRSPGQVREQLKESVTGGKQSESVGTQKLKSGAYKWTPDGGLQPAGE